MEHDWIASLQRTYPQVDLRHDTFFDPVTRQMATTDMLVEGVHFSRQWFGLADIGWKSLAVNLSDIAATGGVAKQALIGLAAPAQTTQQDLAHLYEGLNDCAQAFRVQVVGGDTVRAPQLSLCVTVLGTLPYKSQPGRRHTAQDGDVVAISSPHGLSRAGLYAFEHNLAGYDFTKRTHLRPQPALKLGQQVAAVVPHFAMMDTSDGLADAALRIAEASQVDIVLDATRLLCHPEVSALAQHAHVNPLDWVLYGGEDFALFVTMPPETVGMFESLTVVGRVEAAKTPVGKAYLATSLNERLELSFNHTFQHFGNLENRL